MNCSCVIPGLSPGLAGAKAAKQGNPFRKLHKSAEDGEPLARVPHGQTVHRTVWPPLLSFFSAGNWVSFLGQPQGASCPPQA